MNEKIVVTDEEKDLYNSWLDDNPVLRGSGGQVMFVAGRRAGVVASRNSEINPLVTLKELFDKAGVVLTATIMGEWKSTTEKPPGEKIYFSAEEVDNILMFNPFIKHRKFSVCSRFMFDTYREQGATHWMELKAPSTVDIIGVVSKQIKDLTDLKNGLESKDL